MSYEDKLKLAQAMVVPRKNCRQYDYGEKVMHEHVHDENCTHEQIVVKGRSEGATTMSPDQMQQVLANLIATRRGARIDPPLPTSEQILEKRKIQLQENAKQRRIRKSVKNKALSVATSKHDRRRIDRGATAQELQAVPVAASNKRARTIRREAARKMAKLSRKFSTPSQTA